MHNSGGERSGYRALLPRSKKGIVALGLTAGLLSGVGATAYSVREDIGVMVSDRSPTEKQLLDALKGSVLPADTPVRIDCKPDKGFEPQPLPSGVWESQGYTTPIWGSNVFMPVLHIRESLCEDAVSFIGQPKDLLPTAEQVIAMKAIVHEAEHVKRRSHDEQQVECDAFQEVGKYAVRLGLQPGEPTDVFNQVLTFEYDNHLSSTYSSSECRDGGPYDLDPQHVGFFPN